MVLGNCYRLLSYYMHPVSKKGECSTCCFPFMTITPVTKQSPTQFLLCHSKVTEISLLRRPSPVGSQVIKLFFGLPVELKFHFYQKYQYVQICQKLAIVTAQCSLLYSSLTASIYIFLLEFYYHIISVYKLATNLQSLTLFVPWVSVHALLTLEQIAFVA